ncbi:MAG: (E)-4-hydroxy-3-methylbut-2-enyl-diphosphate synthase [Paludibacteraceae bacterium]|nr:(E)-4-hydroxy-3-methylbut-2-enyl-diphosphate synthase [Paludibacteraceae bacterium]
MNINLKYERRQTSTTLVGGLSIGSAYPIRIQTMANTSTTDIDASVQQAIRCQQAGAELLRYTTQGIREVEAVAEIRKRIKEMGDGKWELPLVADIHFRSDVADAAAEVVEKVRINPGNYANDPSTIRERFTHLIDICKAHHTALRIGVNHGSLSHRIMNQYGDTPEGMVASCMEFLRIAVEQDFHDIVLSIKASNTHIMVDTVRLLVTTMDQENMHFPLHLGVTEAGEGEDGRVKSAVGIGALLADGIGDTVRVSLSEEPECEIPVAQQLVNYFTQSDSIRYSERTIVSYDEDNHAVFYYTTDTDWTTFALHAAAETGRLLWHYHSQKLQLLNPHFSTQQLEQLSQDILQAAGIIRHKVEFVSCPGCGRTMFDLQKTVQQIKTAFSTMHCTSSIVNFPKIAIMGCIVNGPGEMADADYGYVGAGRDRISLYKGKECVLKNIPQEQAVEKLIELINQQS